MSHVSQPAAEASAEQRYQALLEITDAVAFHDDLGQLLHHLAYRLSKIVRFDSVSFVLHDPAANVMRLVHAEASGQELPLPETMSIESSASGRVWRTGEPLVIAHLGREQHLGPALKILRESGFQSCCVLPMTVAEAAWAL
jgi:formate hydrogenlyase transcriptional activator